MSRINENNKDVCRLRASSSGRRSGKKRARYIVAPWLILFPYGLLRMWSSRCKWPKAVKISVSTLIAAALIAVIIPQTLPPERTAGGVRLVGVEPQTDVLGPEVGETFTPIEPYMPKNAEPNFSSTPTPEEYSYLTVVYVNDNGQFYHAAECRYITNSSNPKAVYLNNALTAGYERCSECDAPEMPAE